jgi:hypothetical protein
VSLVLTGGYIEERRMKDGSIACIEVRPWTLNCLTANTYHRVDLIKPEEGCWTLFLRGPRVQGWGFWNRETGAFRDMTQDASTED